MGRGNCLNRTFVTISGHFGHNKTPEAIKRWVTEAGGECSQSLTEDTTHVILSEEHWKRQVSLVKQALKRDDVKIVSFDWLNGCLSNGRKVSTRPYEWAKLDKTVLKKQKQKEKLRAKQNKKEQESYAQAFGEHVGQFTGPHDGTHDASFGNNEDEATTRAKQAFRKGAKAASQDLLSDNYHIYQDNTGFRYEVRLSKIDIERNLNSVVDITLFESNQAPPQYACTIRTSPSIPQSDSHVLSAVGSAYATAFRSFKLAFGEHTKIAWDDRIDRCVARKKTQGPLTQVRSHGFVTSQQIVQAGGVSDPAARIPSDEAIKEFETKPYTYRLPPEGEPRGDLPPPKKTQVHASENARRVVGEVDAGMVSAPEAVMMPAPEIYSEQQSIGGALNDNIPFGNDYDLTTMTSEAMGDVVNGEVDAGMSFAPEAIMMTPSETVLARQSAGDALDDKLFLRDDYALTAITSEAIGHESDITHPSFQAEPTPLVKQNLLTPAMQEMVQPQSQVEDDYTMTEGEDIPAGETDMGLFPAGNPESMQHIDRKDNRDDINSDDGFVV